MADSPYRVPSMYSKDERKRLIKSMLADGLSVREIGKRMGGVTQEAIYYHIRKMGI